MPSWFVFNKYVALIIILIILIVGYYVTSRKKDNFKGSKKRDKNGKKKKKPKKAGSKRSGRSSETSDDMEESSLFTEIDEENEGGDSSDEEDNIRKDAEELYNVAHDSLCQGVQQEEFEELTGDLADKSIFIELKQLYNHKKQKGQDPSRSVTVDDYVSVLKAESD